MRAQDSQVQTVHVYETRANRICRPAPMYRVGHGVWLSSSDIPLRVENHKLAPVFIGPFPITKLITPVAVRLHLPRPLRIHPTFYVSHLKPEVESELVDPDCRSDVDFAYWISRNCLLCMTWTAFLISA